MLCSKVHPKLDLEDQRYHTNDSDELEVDPRFMRYKVNPEDEASDGEEGEERRGVLHLVQGWIQRNQPTKVRWYNLLLSGDETFADALRFWVTRVSFYPRNLPAVEWGWVEFGAGTG